MSLYMFQKEQRKVSYFTDVVPFLRMQGRHECHIEKDTLY